MQYSVKATSYRSFYSYMMPKPNQRRKHTPHYGNWQGITFTICRWVGSRVIYALCRLDNYSTCKISRALSMYWRLFRWCSFTKSVTIFVRRCLSSPHKMCPLCTCSCRVSLNPGLVQRSGTDTSRIWGRYSGNGML